ncbi:hypothetical protein [Bradyrhizobium lablabi]|uniref:hypothetical protein n=1 Tax=Bradyrhizobium lablabi TaxID=722472 RepID=UPI001BABCF80|nr:hypothetical protein [Bradyrhizobium lablabi]MBR0693279.1 hypothetical protein [Bradyrhizobium lablabi]
MAIIVRALISYLAGAGLDADKIRATKPYIRRFIDDVTAGRGRSMHHVSATYWNRIAESQPLATTWARRMFSLPPNELDKALDREETRLTRKTNDPVLAAAYLKVMPLLWERSAISNYLDENPSLRGAILPMESLTEVLRTARTDFQLSASQTEKLAGMLKNEPKCEVDPKQSCSVIRLKDLPILGFVDGPGPFDPIEAWERFVTELRSAPAMRGKYDEIRRAEETIDRMRRDHEGN